MRRAAAIGIALLALFVSSRVSALGDADRFDVALLSMGAAPSSDSESAVARLAWELEKRTSVVTAPKPVVLIPGAPAVRRHPFLALHGAGALPPLDERSLDTLRSHLEAGGLLLIDAADAERPLDDDPFDRDVRLLVRRLFPRGRLEAVPRDHVLWKTFYLLPAALGRRARAAGFEGLTIDGRLAIVYSRNDMLGALARDRLGAFSHAVEPGGESQREQALRGLINVVMYALCGDYKADQVHKIELQRRRGGR